jgi:hypothetical protein
VGVLRFHMKTMSDLGVVESLLKNTLMLWEFCR